MATVTLVESAKLTDDLLISGVIEDIITTNRMFEFMPFTGIQGNAIRFNRENTLGPVATAGVGSTDGVIGPNASSGDNLAERQAAKNPATFTEVTAALTTILGDAEVNGLIQATRSDRVDQTAVQISSKAKSAGRKFQDMMINGTGADFQFSGLLSLVPASQKTTITTASANGDALSFEMLDELLDLPTAKDGVVDFIAMSKREFRSYKKLLRASNGAGLAEVMDLPGGRTILGYAGVPILVNDWIPVNQTKGASTNCSTIFAGCWDDGSNKVGLAGLTAMDMAGLAVVDVGEHSERDEHIWRVKWYVGMALFSQRAIASASGVLPA